MTTKNVGAIKAPFGALRTAAPDGVTVAATDGSCFKNPGPGGWAWVTPDGRNGSGGLPRTTNNAMELTAVLEVLRAVDGPLAVATDSSYVVDCLCAWAAGWKKAGWKARGGKPIKNLDLIQAILSECEGRWVRIQWVRGHNGHPLNEKADRLAVEATRQQSVNRKR